jgi:hypothetical protein
MKLPEFQGSFPSRGNNDAGQERERLLGERQRIVARLQELDQRQIASYIRPPYLDALQSRAVSG